MGVGGGGWSSTEPPLNPPLGLVCTKNGDLS